MTWSFDHFLLSFHVSGNVQPIKIENMPVEVLDLGEKYYVELLFTNGKSHLLRNVIDKIV